MVGGEGGHGAVAAAFVAGFAAAWPRAFAAPDRDDRRYEHGEGQQAREEGGTEAIHHGPLLGWARETRGGILPQGSASLSP